MTGRAWADQFESAQPKRSRRGDGVAEEKKKVVAVGEGKRKARLRCRYLVCGGHLGRLGTQSLSSSDALKVNESHSPFFILCVDGVEGSTSESNHYVWTLGLERTARMVDER